MITIQKHYLIKSVNITPEEREENTIYINRVGKESRIITQNDSVKNLIALGVPLEPACFKEPYGYKFSWL